MALATLAGRVRSHLCPVNPRIRTHLGQDFATIQAATTGACSTVAGVVKALSVIRFAGATRALGAALFQAADRCDPGHFRTLRLFPIARAFSDR